MKPEGIFLGLPPGPCATAINNALTAAGLPTVIASRSDKILLANLPAARSSILANGTGVDHLDVSPVTGAIISVVETVFSTNPACGA